MDVLVSLLTAEREKVNTLSGNCLPHCFSNAMDQALQREVFVKRKIASDMLAMFSRRDQRVAVERWVFVEKGNCRTILVNDMNAIRPARDYLTDETWTGLDCADVRL